MGRGDSCRYPILLFLLVPVLAETPGQHKAGLDSKAQCIRDGDPGNHCFSTLSQSLDGNLLFTSNLFSNESTRKALLTVGNLQIKAAVHFLAIKKGYILKDGSALRS